jgi:uncharacterized membrane protein YczE
VTVLVAGWALGGTVGIGTVAYAVAIGPLAQVFLGVFDTQRVWVRRAAPRSVAVEVGEYC